MDKEFIGLGRRLWHVSKRRVLRSAIARKHKRPAFREFNSYIKPAEAKARATLIAERRSTGNCPVIAHVANCGILYEGPRSRRDRQHYYRTAGDCEATADEHHEAESKSE